ncbi:hypothetical protein Pan97_44030 [Bremerella volcania]|uniref:Uncharacterized protein n=1 Tax=Bremerella volcania TaxID=2527984 RepID=A0A518CDN1_9BACT|nr:hypothetical protein Pan97_44030 [Bremerella volcania]
MVTVLCARAHNFMGKNLICNPELSTRKRGMQFGIDERRRSTPYPRDQTTQDHQAPKTNTSDPQKKAGSQFYTGF